MQIYENYNRKKIWTYPFLAAFLFAITLLAQKPEESAGEPYKGIPQLFQYGRLYYSDRAQTRLYTGEYREYHDNGTSSWRCRYETGSRKEPISSTLKIGNQKMYALTKRGNCMAYGGVTTFRGSLFPRPSTETV